MCGIVGIVSDQDVVQDTLDGLKRLEYRGYDSAGIATLHKNTIHRRRAEGKLKNLTQLCEKKPIQGTVSIGHTRWATHGTPVEANAHPHANHRIALVHNGIIENYSELKAELEKKYTFESQTDTEVIVHAIEDELALNSTPLLAVQAAVKKLKGAYALAILFKDDPDTLYAVRQGSPLVIGVTHNTHDDDPSPYHGTAIGSDAISLAPLADQLCYLDDGDIAVLKLNTVRIFNKQDAPVIRPFVKNPIHPDTIGKGPFRHYMLKEIHDQPNVLGHSLQHLLGNDADHLASPYPPIDLTQTDRLSLIACGSSYITAMVAKYWFETYARIPVDVDIASEFRYRSPVFSKNHMCVFISQSGETSDTLSALELSKQHTKTIALVNVPQSSMARVADHVILTHAGPEIGVASTKAFTCQMLSLLSLALEAAKQRGHLNTTEESRIIHVLRTLPTLIHTCIMDEKIEPIAQSIMDAAHVIFLGRGPHYPIAMEGALKLKEVTYIPAHAYASGELKHGPIALVDEHVPIFMIAPHDHWFEKSASNLQEVAARQGRITVLTDGRGAAHFMNVMPNTFHIGQNMIVMPDVDPLLQPFLYTLPLQLLAYHTGVKKGTDVDQPRNLAKSVTVE